MSYIIVIPTHKRNQMARDKTLRFLRKHDIPDNIIFIMPSLATEWEEREGENYNIIRGQSESILDARNNIIQYFDEGQQIIEMDDDIDDIIDKEGQGVVDLKAIIKRNFERSEGSLWGFCSNDNMYFSNGMLKIGLYSIINSFLGYTNDKSIHLTMKEKEDFERCILFWKKGKNCYKFTDYGIKTKYWKNKGGLQAKYNEADRNAVQKKVAIEMYEKYPTLTFISERKNGKTDIKFKRQKTNKNVEI